MNVNFLDRSMCSTTCPCDPQFGEAWRNAFDEEKLNERRRTWNDPPKDPKQLSTMVFGGGSKQYHTFEDCYREVILGNEKTVFKDHPNQLEAYNDFTSANTISLLRYYENEYDCSGICDLPLFYLTKSMEEGPPTEDCAESVVK